MAAAAPPAAPTATGARMPVGALLLLAVTIAAGMAMQSVFSPIQETIKLDLGLSDFRMSLLQGVAASIPVALLALPFGRLIDRSNRIRLLVLLAVTWTAGTLLTVAAQSFLLLFVARTLAGIGAVLAIMVGISIAADLTEPARRGRALLLLSLGKNIGLASSFALGGWLFARLEQGPALFGLEPWRGVHLAFGLVAALLVLPLLLLREPARREVAEGVDIPVRTALGEVWERRALLVPLFIGQVTVTMADVAALIWSAPVLERSYGLAPADFAGWMGLVVLLSGIGGSLAGGFAADAGHKSKVAGGILIGAVAAATLSIPGAFFAVMPSVTGFALMLALLLLCGGVTGLVTATAIAVLVPNEIRGLCLGAFMVVGAIIGYGVAPTLVTLVSQLLGGEDQIRYALVGSGALTSLVAALGFVRAMRSASVRSI